MIQRVSIRRIAVAVFFAVLCVTCGTRGDDKQTPPASAMVNAATVVETPAPMSDCSDPEWLSVPVNGLVGWSYGASMSASNIEAMAEPPLYGEPAAAILRAPDGSAFVSGTEPRLISTSGGSLSMGQSYYLRYRKNPAGPPQYREACFRASSLRIDTPIGLPRRSAHPFSPILPPIFEVNGVILVSASNAGPVQLRAFGPTGPIVGIATVQTNGIGDYAEFIGQADLTPYVTEQAQVIPVVAEAPGGDYDVVQISASTASCTFTPTTTITGGPAPGSYINTPPVFTFTSSPSAYSYQCRMGCPFFTWCAGSWQSCSSPKSYAGFAFTEGQWSFSVRGTNLCGTGPTTGRTFFWDTVPPDTSISACPSNHAPGYPNLTNSANPVFTYGATESGTTRCTEPYPDGGTPTFGACPNGSYTAPSPLASGLYQFQVAGIDAAGNQDATPAICSFEVDLLAPDTTITAGPSGPTSSTTAVFEFTSSEPGTFECQIDGGAFASCGSGVTYTGLTPGSHFFAVRAIDLAQNLDSTPASAAFVVDVQAPTPQITGCPVGAVNGNYTNDDLPELAFQADEPSSFRCVGPFVSGTAAPAPQGCSSGFSTTGSYTVPAGSELADGSWEFRVEATDPAGNVSSPLASCTFNVDTEAPAVSLSGPPSPTNDDPVVLTFTTSASDLERFTCNDDGATVDPCSSPYAANWPADATHAFSVQAVDLAHNTSAPASVSIVVDRTPPLTSLSRFEHRIAFGRIAGGGEKLFVVNTNGTGTGMLYPTRAGSQLAPAWHFSSLRIRKLAFCEAASAGESEILVDAFDGSGPVAITSHAGEDCDPHWSPDGTQIAFVRSENGNRGVWTISADGTGATQVDAGNAFGVRDIAWSRNGTLAYTMTDATGASTSLWVVGPGGIPGEIDAGLDTVESLDWAPDGTRLVVAATQGASGGLYFIDSTAYQVERALTTDATDGDPAWSPDGRRVVFSRSAGSERLLYTIDALSPGASAVALTTGTDLEDGHPAWSAPVRFPDSHPSFLLTSNEPGTFECALDSTAEGSFAACSSPYVVPTGVTADSHTLYARAIDMAANRDASPEAIAFELVRPPTLITSAPSGTTNQASPVYFCASATTNCVGAEAADFDCAADSDPYFECESPADVSGLTDGSHIFRVRAVDEWGNTDASPAEASFTLDRLAPVTTIAGPAFPSGPNAPEFTFTANEPVLYYECRIEQLSEPTSSGDFEPCSPVASFPLADGYYELAVRAYDTVGNLEDPPKLKRFVLGADIAPPSIAFTAPASGALVTEGFPTLAISYDDVGDGLNLTSLALSSETGFPPTTCTPAPFSATCVTNGLVPDGTHLVFASITDNAGNTSTAWVSFTVWVDSSAPSGPDGSNTTVSGAGGNATVTGGAGATEPNAEIRVTNTRTGQTTVCTADGTGAFSCTVPATGLDSLSIVACDGASNCSDALLKLVPPANPADVAPSIDRSVVTDFVSATSFLYSGPDRVQQGIIPGTIDATRVSIVRGIVLDTSVPGASLGGVRVSVAGRPEFGYTATRTDGAFDLAVNGGAALTLRFELEGYLPVDRSIDPQWKEYVAVEDIRLTRLDPFAADVSFVATTSMQVAQGSVVNDLDGPRQATLLFPSGTEATLHLPDGSTRSLAGGRVRATEYTVGEGGRAAMPAPLPPMSGYTYAAELSIDEAIQANADEITFDEPVLSYVDNFLGMPVGSAVPSGTYDRKKQAWVGMPDGRVVEIAAIDGGLAELVIDGSGLPADEAALAALGVTLEERAKLATLYVAGQQLWRVPHTHFSPKDYNWPFIVPAALQPDVLPPQDRSCQSTRGGSIIGCENQTLGEVIPLAGTSVSLRYDSSRAIGSKPRLEIPLTGATVPPGIEKIRLRVTVAGRTTDLSFPRTANLVHEFVWDRLDAYGRLVQGPQVAAVSVGFVVNASYLQPSGGASVSFGVASGDPGFVFPAMARQSDDFTVWQELTLPIGGWDASVVGLGGWDLEVHHAYDAQSGTVFEGNGSFQNDTGLTIEPVTQTSAAVGIAVGADGSIYIADTLSHRVMRWNDGVLTRIAGTGAAGFSGDGGPAKYANLNHPNAVTVAADGTLYIADTVNNRVRKVTPSGTITTVAGTGAYSFSGDGGPATGATFRGPTGLDLGSDGSLYVADSQNDRVRRIDPSGTILTVAGGGTLAWPETGDGGLATLAVLYLANDVKIAADGSMFIADTDHGLVRRVGNDGVITTIAGGIENTNVGDGGPAVEARLDTPIGLALDRTGNVYVGVDGAVRRIGVDGLISSVAGVQSELGCLGDGQSGAFARLQFPTGLDVAPDGTLLIADNGCSVIRAVKSKVATTSAGEFLVPGGGGDLYVFSPTGRHLRTIDALTGALRIEFAYDTQGRLSSVTDADENTLTIERTGDVPSAIVAPGGQRTELTVDGAGYLRTVANSAGETFTLTHDVQGLLASFQTPRGHSYDFTYDTRGRLLLDSDPAGGSYALARTVRRANRTVTGTTALGRVTQYSTDLTSDGVTSTRVEPDGTTWTTAVSNDRVRRSSAPDGSLLTTTLDGDPRFKMASPYAAIVSYQTPGGRTLTMTEARTATLANPSDVFSYQTLSISRTIDEKTFNTTFNRTNRTLTRTSPMSRSTSSTFDVDGRITEMRVGALAPVRLVYDTRGRVTRVWADSGSEVRAYEYAYDDLNRPISVTDPLGRTTSFAYDGADRVNRTSFADGREVLATYDANGNVATLTPPGKPAHGFTHTQVDLESRYTPPTVAGSGTNATDYEYSSDRELAEITRPDLATVAFSHDATSGRLTAITHTHGSIALGYHATTGQLSTLSESNGETLTFGWDAVLPTSETWSGTVSGSITRTFDNHLRLSAEAVNGGNLVAYSHDDDGLITGAGALTINRDPVLGLIDSTTLGTVTTSRQYNAFAEPLVDVASTSAGEIYRAAYTRDRLGRITQKVETVEGTPVTWDYVYDTSGRLTRISKDGIQVSEYSFDANGNRLSHTTPGGTVGATHDDQDRLLTYGASSFTWTPNGELASKTDATGTTTYTYDALGNLRNVVLPNGDVIDYVIDGRNRRVGKKVNGVLTQGWLYRDQLEPVAELDGTGNVVARFVYGSKPHVPDYMVKAGITYRIVSGTSARRGW